MILKTYIIRTLKDPINLVMLILFPIAMVSVMTFAANASVEGYHHIFNGFNLFATGNTSFNAVFFQFFCGLIVTDTLYLEFRSDMRWRLMATPNHFSKFIISAIISSILVSILNGAVILGFGRFVLNAHLHNIFITSATLIIMSIFVTLIGVLCFMIFPKKATTTAIMFVFAFAQMLPLQFGMLSIESGTVTPVSFLPVIAANNALVHSGQALSTFVEGNRVMLDTDIRTSLIHLAILLGYTLITGIAVAFVGRRRPI